MEAERRASEVEMEEMEISELNIDISVDKISELQEMFRSLADEFECLDSSQSRRIGKLLKSSSIHNEGLKDPVLKKYIVDDSKLFASIYDKLKTVFKTEGWIGKMSETSSKYKGNPELEKHFSDWLKSRKKLIIITKSAAEELDRPFFIVNLTRIISSLIEILNLLNLGIYQLFCCNITSYAYNISSHFGFLTESALELVPNLRFLGLASTFFDILQSQAIINNVVNAIKNDQSKFLPIKHWLDETNELDFNVRKLFPHRIKKEIIKSIENTLEDLGKEEKIFSATVLSNLLEDPMIYKNERFMIKAFLFCLSDDAKEWYKRLITDACSLNLECEMFDFQKKFLQLEESHPDSASKLELGKRSIDQLEYIITKNIGSNLSQYFIFSMSGMSIYYCFKNIRTGSKHMYSDKLRELSRNAQFFLNAMEKIRFCHL